jgi:hypothetical protein
MQVWQIATEIIASIYHSIANDERKPNICSDSELMQNLKGYAKKKSIVFFCNFQLFNLFSFSKISLH